jgi:hypothetical protein
VQLLVLGFSHPEFHGEIAAELERLRESDTVRVIDALAVHKDAEGELEVQHLSNLTKEEAIELGSKVGALIGLGIEGEEGMEAGAVAGAEAAADGIDLLSTDQAAWDVLEDIPNDSARRSCCSSTTGRCRCVTRSRARAVPDQRQASSAPRPRRGRPRHGRGGEGAAHAGDAGPDG